MGVSVPPSLLSVSAKCYEACKQKVKLQKLIVRAKVSYISCLESPRLSFIAFLSSSFHFINYSTILIQSKHNVFRNVR